MKTTLEQSLRIGFPEIYPYAMLNKEGNANYKEYMVLRHFGMYCSTHFDEHASREIIAMINSHYQSKDLFIQNAIENEFLYVIAEKLGTQNFLNHLNLIPGELQLSYVKVLLETLKHKKK